MVGRKVIALGATLLLLASCGAMATLVPIGTGDSQADLYVEFADGANYTFEVSFNGPMSGMGLFDAVEAATDLTTVRVFDAAFIDGVTYDGHSNIGFGGGENWWHYWIKEPGGDWTMSFISATDRVVVDGTADAWIYGRDSAPVPEPATALSALMAAGLAFIRTRRGMVTTR